MHFLATLPFLILSVLASPAPQAAPPPASADATTTHLYICTDAMFTGNCNNLQLSVSDCHNVPDDYNKKVSSAGPDEGTFCTLYSDLDCHGEALPFTFPGIQDLGRYGFDDVLSSVRCDFIAGWHSHP